jgi:PAS domain S-box-containing protein
MSQAQFDSPPCSDAAVLDVLAVMVVVADRDGRVVNFNRACTAITGFTAEEVLGRPFVDVLLHPDEAADVKRNLSSIDDLPYPLRRERRWVDKTGRGRLIALTIDAIRGGDGRVEYLAATGVEVTAQRAAERDAITWRTRAETFLDHAPTVVFLRDTDERYLYVNRRFEEISGRERGEVLGSTPEELWTPEEAALLRTQDAEALESSAPVRHAYTLMQDGEEHHYLSVKFQLRRPDGSLEGIAGIATDITDRVRSSEELDASYRETITRLARAVELRDTDTGGHVERMSEYCEMIAVRLGLDDRLCQAMRAASAMHDAGKIAIPDSILLSPRRLTADERAVIETHAAIGHELLAGSSSPVLRLAAEIAHTHHERYDGSGYPRGLAGDEIPVEGRIAAVADVFDALTNDRPYRPALSLEAALELMQAERGTQFDPVVLDAFLGLLEQIEPLARPAARHSADAAARPGRGGHDQPRRAPMRGKRIVVIDADDEVRGLLRGGFERREGEVFDAATGEDGVKAVYAARPHLVILDLDTPDLAGWEVLTRIRDLSDVPVVMLSKSDAELEKVRALRAGADAHVTKPISIYEMVARSEALVRRQPAAGDNDARYADALVRVDFERATAHADGHALDLTPLEFRVLTALVRHPDQVLSTGQLLTMAWGDDRLPRERVTVYVGYLRGKFQDVGVEPPIETVRGFGYRYTTGA